MQLYDCPAYFTLKSFRVNRLDVHVVTLIFLKLITICKYFGKPIFYPAKPSSN